MPKFFKSWEENLEWVDKNMRSISDELASKIQTTLRNVVARPRGRYLCFYRGRPSNKSIFAAFVLTGKYLRVKIKTASDVEFKDPEKLLKEKNYRRWFFSTGNEREFVVNKGALVTDVEYALKLIEQSYNLSK
ncbi:MAG: hypothetical protein ABR962_05665 [Candidatus Bathyarchaeia archaeon]